MTTGLENIVTLLAVGAAGGFLSGLLGVGGGIIFVPVLYYIFGHGAAAETAMHVAVGTSLALVMATSGSSAFWHNKKGGVDAGLIKSWLPGIVLGVAAGTALAAQVGGGVLKAIFATVLLLVAVYMALGAKTAIAAAGVPVAVQRGLSGCIAFLAALIGVGGAVLNIPLMTWMGLPMNRAVGTGAALGVVIALPAVIGYIITGWHAPGLPPHTLGYISLVSLVAILPVSMLLSPLGVRVAYRLPRGVLRRIFAAVLFVIALRMLFA